MHELTEKALRLSQAGEHAEAARLMDTLLQQRRSDGSPATLDEHMLRAIFLFNAGDAPQAEAALQETANAFPAEPIVYENLGVVQKRLGRPDDALATLQRAESLGHQSANLHDALCAVYGDLGMMAEAREYGSAALEAKDAASAARGVAYDIPDRPPPEFDPVAPEKNIIAFSLWGNEPRYVRGAIHNALLIPGIYPGWTARFYVDDTVPSSISHQLAQLGAQIVERQKPADFTEASLWRFEVIGDETISRFLVRDVDAIVNTQERAAVDAWLASDRYFHIMRDWYSHTDLVLAGLWGGVGGVLPSLHTLLEKFKPFRVPTRTFDQDFLRLCVWPTAKKSCLIHDSYFDCFNSLPFPSEGRLPAGMHVGQDHTRRRIRPPSVQDRRR